MSENKGLSLDTIGVTAQLEGKALNVGVRSRLATAIDKLAGNLIDVPNWFLDAWKAKKAAKDGKVISVLEAQAEVAAGLIKAEGESAIAKLLKLDGAGERVLAGFLRDENFKQENKIAVLLEATEELKRLPPPVEEAPPADGEPPTAEPLAADWLNMFSAHAERASSDQLRELWGRILAGEIRQPQSFSLSTLRVISEMDRKIAEAFERVLIHRIDDYFLVDNLQDQRWRDMLLIEEFGLIHGADGTMARNFAPEKDGFAYQYNGDHLLKMKLIEKEITKPGMISKFEAPISVARMLRAGREIASIIPASDPTVGLRELASKVMDRMASIELFKVVAPGQGELIDSIKVSVPPS